MVYLGYSWIFPFYCTKYANIAIDPANLGAFLTWSSCVLLEPMDSLGPKIAMAMGMYGSIGQLAGYH